MQNYYVETVVQSSVNIAEGNLESASFNCVTGNGACSLRMIWLPSNWTPCDITFTASLVDESDAAYEAYEIINTDGVNARILTIPDTEPNQLISLFAHWFDAVRHFKIVCSTAQLNAVTVSLSLQPLYQGVHG